MGMTIDEHIEVLKSYHHGFTGYAGNLQDSINIAINTMLKYQKIEQILDIEPVLTLPNNPTNGDMITALIPIEDMWRGYSTERGKQVCVRFAHTEYVTCFDADYWDAPYKAESEDKE